jgi:hypothetical protein
VLGFDEVAALSGGENGVGCTVDAVQEMQACS